MTFSKTLAAADKRLIERKLRVDFGSLPGFGKVTDLLLQIYSSNEANKAARDFATTIAMVYRLSTWKTTIVDEKHETPGLHCLLKHKRKLRKL
jgi:hypothetical protein